MTTLILDPHWRTMDELFSPQAQAVLGGFDIVWGQDAPIPARTFEAALPKADFLIAANPVVTGETLQNAPKLKAVIEVSGAFPETIDYAACARHNVEVLSCAPGFRSAVAEMGLAMTLSAARGLVREHEAFRTGQERWLEDCTETDFTLFGATVGFVGFGQIAQELSRLLAPFAPRIQAFDPWLPKDAAEDYGVTLVSLEDLARQSKVLYVTAVPTSENKGLIGAPLLGKLADNSLVVVLSRAHLVDFEALMAEARSGRLYVATDVFPSEPLDPRDDLRKLDRVLLSPHRAAAVEGGRQLIGDLILRDIDAILQGRKARALSVADGHKIGLLAGVGDATQVADMASKR